MTRARLPNRRPCVTITTSVAGKAVTIGVGYDPVTDTFSEAFADIARGTDAQHTLSDACVAVSVALQHGVPINALEHSLGRVPAWVKADGAMVLGEAPASPVGAVLEAIRAVDRGVRNDPDFFGAMHDAGSRLDIAALPSPVAGHVHRHVAGSQHYRRADRSDLWHVHQGDDAASVPGGSGQWPASADDARRTGQARCRDGMDSPVGLSACDEAPAADVVSAAGVPGGAG